MQKVNAPTSSVPTIKNAPLLEPKLAGVKMVLFGTWSMIALTLTSVQQMNTCVRKHPFVKMKKEAMFADALPVMKAPTVPTLMNALKWSVARRKNVLIT